MKGIMYNAKVHKAKLSDKINLIIKRKADYIFRPQQKHVQNFQSIIVKLWEVLCKVQ